MDAVIKNTITTAAKGSNEGRLHFSEVVGMLMQAGIESYHVDYRACRTTYYLPDGGTYTTTLDAPEAGVAQAFDATIIKAAIRDAQQGVVMYPEFKRLSQAGGCISYTVWITGRHVTYFGRNGETHVERFPD